MRGKPRKYAVDEAELQTRGLCQCGCGGTTPISEKTQTGSSRIRGYHCRFIPGHQCRVPLDRMYVIESLTGCWVWIGRPDRVGYGQIMRNGKRVVAHRFFYETFRSPLPAGTELHHTCGNRACVNPDHLVPLTRSKHARLHRTQGAN